MKKLVIFMLMLACITMSGCGDKTIVNDSISSPIQQTSNSNEQTSSNQEGTEAVAVESSPDVKNETSPDVNVETSPDYEEGSSQNTSDSQNSNVHLLYTDFLVSDGVNSVELYMPFQNFKTNMPEEQLDNNYVGETYSGDTIIKTYMHKYSDLDLYVSNLKSIDEYVITQITLKNSKYKTARGITIGSKLEDVYNNYGRVEKSIVEGKETLIYKLDDLVTSFTIDGNQMVQEVVLMVQTKNS